MLGLEKLNQLDKVERQLSQLAFVDHVVVAVFEADVGAREVVGLREVGLRLLARASVGSAHVEIDVVV